MAGRLADDQNESEPEAALVAAVLTRGISFGMIACEDAVAWADHLTEKTTQPAAWMIELSLSSKRHVLDVLGLLEPMGEDADCVLVCRNLYGYLPDPVGYSIEQAEALAHRIYEMTGECLCYDWRQLLLREADDIDDAFLFVRDHIFHLSDAQLISQVKAFLRCRKETKIRDFLERLPRYTIVERR